MIEEAYVSFETAKLLKEKDFDAYTTAYYDDFDNQIIYYYREPMRWNKSLVPTLSAPTLQMAMKWLREVHSIQIELNWDKGNQLYSFNIWKPEKYQPEISSLDLWRIYKDDNYLGEWNYEEATEEAIKYCLKNLI